MNDNNNKYNMTDILLHLPNKILQHEEIDGIAHLVLHELCHQKGLGFDKVMYLVDNPEFRCMKGIAGYSKEECAHHKKDIWHAPEAFLRDMSKADFHSKIRNFMHESICFAQGDACQELKKLGNNIGIQNPNVYTWQMRNGNKGVLIFQRNDDKDSDSMMGKIAALLGLCRMN